MIDCSLCEIVFSKKFKIDDAMTHCLEYSRYYLDYIPNRYEYREQCPEAQKKCPEVQWGRLFMRTCFKHCTPM